MKKKGFAILLLLGLLLACFLTGILPELSEVLFWVGLAIAVILLAGMLFSSWGSDKVLKIVLSINAILATLVLIDLPLRPMIDNRTFYREHERFAKTHPLYPALIRYRPDVDYTGPAHGDLSAVSRNTTIQEPRITRFMSDSYGFRNDPATMTSHEYSVIVLADSFGVGNGVDQYRIWPHLLGSKHGHKVYNLSQVGGLDVHLMNSMLEAPRIPVSKDAVALLVVFAGNDLEDTGFRLEDFKANSLLKSYAWRWISFRRRSAINRLVKSLLHRSNPDSEVVVFEHAPKIAFLQNYIDAAGRTREEVTNHPNYEVFISTIDALREYYRKNSCDFAVCYMPTKAEVYPWIVCNVPESSTQYTPSGLESILREHCMNNDIPYLDLGVSLSRSARENWTDTDSSLVWWRDDTHINECGHEIAAAAINELLISIDRNRRSSHRHEQSFPEAQGTTSASESTL